MAFMSDLLVQGCRLLLNGEWLFAAAPDGAPPGEGWQRVRVPHRSREFEAEPPVSGWYRTLVQVPADWSWAGGRVLLVMGRVRHYGRAYLDGQVIGEHHHLRRAWRLDLSGRVRPGGAHRLEVYTHNCSGAYAHPQGRQLSEEAERALDTRFWYTSAPTIGIEDDVWLELEPALRLEEVYVVSSVRRQTLAVEAAVGNESGQPWAGQVRWQVLREGRTALELPACPVQVGAGEKAEVRVEVPWVDAVHWGQPPYGEPVLYHLEGTLWEGTGCRHRHLTRFGFREVWAEGDRLLLNGRQLVLWGDHTMPYVYERQWLTRKFAALAAANISIVEHHRCDPPEVFYEVADELGVLVVGANFCVGTGQVPSPLAPAEMELVLESHLEVVGEWLRRARNHPCILFWDITDARDPAYCVPLLRKVKELDPTRIAEVTFDPAAADAELVELIDCYRLFSGLGQIEASIQAVRSGQYPVKPVRVGEAGIFSQPSWPADQEPPLLEGWGEFLARLPGRNLHGLQTFYLADMDYRNFDPQVPGTLAEPVRPQVSWPSQSGRDARIDPFGEGAQEAWGKTGLYLNWCDPSQPVDRPTATCAWSRELFRSWAGRDVGPLSGERVPEVMVRVEEGGKPVAGAQVFAAAVEGQAMAPFGVRADRQGTSWFALPGPGRYCFSCGAARVEVEARMQPIAAPPGYGHVQYVRLELDPGREVDVSGAPAR
jgi:hypothetical protein